MMTPPLSICARPRLTVTVPVCSISSYPYQGRLSQESGGRSATSDGARPRLVLGRSGAVRRGRRRAAAAAGARSGCSDSASASGGGGRRGGLGVASGVGSGCGGTRGSGKRGSVAAVSDLRALPIRTVRPGRRVRLGRHGAIADWRVAIRSLGGRRRVSPICSPIAIGDEQHDRAHCQERSSGARSFGCTQRLRTRAGTRDDVEFCRVAPRRSLGRPIRCTSRMSPGAMSTRAVHPAAKLDRARCARVEHDCTTKMPHARPRRPRRRPRRLRPARPSPRRSRRGRRRCTRTAPRPTARACRRRCVLPRRSIT